VDTAAVFNFQFFCSLFMFGLVATWFVWPRLTRMGRIEALTPLFVYSAFRYLGTFFLVTQMTAGLPREWAGPAAYLDILSASIALIGAFLARFGSRLSIPVAWIYGFVGAAAFAHGAMDADKYQTPLHIGPVMPMMTVLGPSWMITIGLIFFVLLKHPKKGSI